MGPFWGHWLKFCSTWPPQLVVFLVPEHPRKMVLLLLMAVDIICAVDMDDANTPHGVLRERGGKFGARISNLQAVPLCRIAAPFFFLKFSSFRA